MPAYNCLFVECCRAQEYLIAQLVIFLWTVLLMDRKSVRESRHHYIDQLTKSNCTNLFCSLCFETLIIFDLLLLIAHHLKNLNIFRFHNLL